MLLTITSTARRRPTSATCCTSTPARCRRSSSRSAGRTSSTPRRATSAARRRCCSRSTRSGWSRGQRGAARGAARAVRQRPAVRRLVVPERRDRAASFGTALAAGATSGRSWPTTPLPLAAHARGRCPCAAARRSCGGCSSRWATRSRPSATPLDETFPEWGDEPLLHRRARRREVALARAARHLYVLVPVLDDDKHYWVGDDEVEKLLRHGEGWLAAHPERELIARRYLSTSAASRDEALARLARATSTPTRMRGGERSRPRRRRVERADQPQRAAARAVVAALRGARRAARARPRLRRGRAARARCSRTGSSTEIVGVDVSHRALEIAARPAASSTACPSGSASASSCSSGSLTYRDQRLAGYDAAAVVEVIEHLDPPRLAAFERVAVRAPRGRHGRA